jgi:3-hydroxymyristoyl/3-hydroxydecanoyl-(acyl carrier protein) dehydratase
MVNDIRINNKFFIGHFNNALFYNYTRPSEQLKQAKFYGRQKVKSVQF